MNTQIRKYSFTDKTATSTSCHRMFQQVLAQLSFRKIKGLGLEVFRVAFLTAMFIVPTLHITFFIWLGIAW